MKFYKLTDENMKTYNSFQWELGKWYEIAEENRGYGLCSKSYFHCYDHPLLAVLLNPIYADFKNPRLFEIEVDGDLAEDNGLKFGFTKMRLVKEIDVPQITNEQKIKFAIYCSLERYDDESFVKWAQNWLNGKDRSAARSAADTAADAAARSAEYAARSAEWDADAADAAADTAEYAAWAAAWAAADAAEYAAWAAADAAARSAAWAAEYAARSAEWDAARSAKKIDLIAIAELACEETE